ncbi:MAG: hypothetical protein A3E78_07220 [Alphaproteobacteria bacterium RIFCSPHIGHO2_12_FULL_63_12]|nr:MAG: hypothetical protein A3E78_07220 [Alphaproteobacteria bacterium RIFCSPHIGHO2_12_FULL_63_12]
MAQALTQAPLFFYAQPTKPSALGNRWVRFVDTARKFAQGAGTPALAYSGAANAADVGGMAPTVTDFTTLDGFTQAVLDGRLTGPAQLIAGAFLFLAAGRCTARLVGLAAGVALIYLYTQGHTLAEGLTLSKEFVSRLIAAFDAFQNAGGGTAT